jgi:hypothetical protein
VSDDAGICWYCERIRGLSVCCSSHAKALCHECYRRTHFVERCYEGCKQCAREGLPVILSGYTQTARERG